MEFHQVRYFLSLCTTLNFTRAAEACNVTQPALTRAIQRLEEEFGGPLFQRERNLTQLTELGRLMRPLMEQTLAAAESAKEHAARFRKAEVASLRLGLLPTVSPAIVGASLTEIIRRIPAVEIEIRSAPQLQLIEALLQGELDTALIATGEAPAERLDSWVMFKESFRVAFRAGHRFEALDRVPASALAGESVLGRAGCTAISALRDRCGTEGAGFAVRHLGETEEQLQYLAAAGLGVLVLPQHLKLLEELVVRPLAEPGPTREIVLCAVAGRRRSPALDAFIRLSRARDFAPLLAAA
jgi:LysR family hydrogen peroxide-inducible transcriptional activator